MKIEADWLTDPGPRAVLAALARGGHRALYVGGTVRNALLGLAPGDIDIATDARPERVMALAAAAGLRPVPTGVEHGTVTVVADHRGIEVTTFRRDVETDGRRAVVAFSDLIEHDAERRDFTMNALYATAEGEVIDPLGGLPDLLARRVRFVGDPGARIAEDYLRILRFFRFHAWYGDPTGGLDAEGLAACAGNLGGLSGLSRERVGAEMKKLLAAPDPAPAVAAMAQAGALARALPGADARALAPLVHLEAGEGLAPDPIRRLAVLGGEDAAGALRLSRAEARRLEALREAAGSAAGPAELGYRLGAEPALSAAVLRAAMTGAPVPPGARGDADRGASARFPVAAADLAPLSGAALGARLKDLEARWIASGFTLDRAQLLG
ncbi:MAG: CCA tRNA nucleotidyltransferase [Rhodobacteraceae bacterium]|jgi:poly(A) polymerase|nr:CCA tRNA nucleotidyltransferase [Paracoccaceae bacterium]